MERIEYFNDETGVTIYVEWNRYDVECYALDSEGEEVVLDSFEQRQWIEQAGQDVYDQRCDVADAQLNARREDNA